MSEIEVIGRHRVLCGDSTTGAVRTLMGDEKADVVYTDPPWGQALLTSFATMAKITPRLPWRGFVDELARVIVEAAKPGAPIFVEIGTRWEKDVLAAMGLYGMSLRRRWEVTYGPNKDPRPSLLLLFGADVEVTMPTPAHGEPVTRAALAAVVREGTVVLDPCTGLGMTARVTHSLGGAFRGVELNPERLERTAVWLRRKRLS